MKKLFEMHSVREGTQYEDWTPFSAAQLDSRLVVPKAGHFGLEIGGNNRH